MKMKQGSPVLAGLLAGAGLVAASSPVLADVELECRQEAEEYGIPPEEMADYINGCVLSRGGYPEELAGDEIAPPADSDDAGEAATAVGE